MHQVLATLPPETSSVKRRGVPQSRSAYRNLSASGRLALDVTIQQVADTSPLKTKTVLPPLASSQLMLCSARP